LTKTTKKKTKTIRSASSGVVGDTTKKARKVMRKQRKLVA